jgi:hypothetical protein
MAQLNPILSASPLFASVGDAFSWITVKNDINRELYAQAVYNVNNGNNYDKVSEPILDGRLGLVLSANPFRKALYCRNFGEQVLYLKLGEGASDSSFHIALKGSDDGFGEMFFDEQVYMGEVSIYGLSADYILWEGI